MALDSFRFARSECRLLDRLDAHTQQACEDNLVESSGSAVRI